jgi:hypothetical protein
MDTVAEAIAALIRFERITLPIVLLIAVVVIVLDLGEVKRQISEGRAWLPRSRFWWHWLTRLLPSWLCSF